MLLSTTNKMTVCIIAVLFLSSLHMTSAGKACERDGRKVSVPANNPAPDCRYPYLVSIKHPLFKTHLCGGTLIKPNYVLTAASCLAGIDSPIASINSYYLDGPAEDEITIVQVKNHPDYSSSGINTGFDVAVAQLKSSSSQPTVDLAKSPPSKNSNAIVVGWGREGPQGAFSSEMQQSTGLKIGLSSCSSVPSGMICAGKDNVNICEGDTGGPLIAPGNNPNSDVQIGVVSKAVGDCSRNKKPGLFVDVAAIIDWIQKET